MNVVPHIFGRRERTDGPIAIGTATLSLTSLPARQIINGSAFTAERIRSDCGNCCRIPGFVATGTGSSSTARWARPLVFLAPPAFADRNHSDRRFPDRALPLKRGRD